MAGDAHSVFFNFFLYLFHPLEFGAPKPRPSMKNNLARTTPSSFSFPANVYTHVYM